MKTRYAVLVAAVLAGATVAGCEREAATPAAAVASGADGREPAAIAAAGDAPAEQASAADRAEAIRAAAAQWPTVEGRWTRGDTDSRYVAWFDGGQLRYLEEDLSSGDAGRGRNRYYFDGGALFYYAGEKASAVPGGAGPGALPPSVPVVAEFRGSEVVRAVAREHYGERRLDAAAIDALRRHAAALAGAAQDEWSAQQP